ncbi:ComEA family DNA-binding protein [Brevibacterium spongiae]|uniref:ComEA family DNA-binding protein n=1 Tax=Brevibacterium spongiae TaxID=2909672 RepID=A0ABY5SNA1_9MICO|nr:ComEA family DNA-binding protein [Brevibacterium spongiae]UVI34554.1 ComEA family DNA-binding protein [Brevibacterium spongiae]
MAVSPDDRFAGLLNASAERGGWVPGDVFTADTAGEEEPVAPRRVRLPILVAVALATVGVLILAFFLFRPADQHAATETGGNSSGNAGGQDDGRAADESAGSSSAPDDGQPEKEGTNDAQEGAASAKADGKVIVHVTGAVKTPSVVTLKAGARVQDAVEAAGGLDAGADAESVNLARVLGDGEQIHIPTVGEAPAAAAADEGGAGGGPGSDTGGAAGPDPAASSDPGVAANGAGGAGPEGAGDAPGAGGKVDLNSADLTALQTLPGVGPVTAEAIVSHRQAQPFGSVEDLLLVKGIGPKTFESLKDLVTVG